MNPANISTSATMAMMQATQSDAKLNISEKNMEKIETTAREFEAVFISEMMKPMFDGIKTDGMFGGGKGEEVFRSILLQEYGKVMSQTGQVGIASHVKESLIQMQAQQQLAAQARQLPQQSQPQA
jgi:peptidoglycan hydrolase FlgJ